MPFSGGTFALRYDFRNDLAAGAPTSTIRAGRTMEQLEDIATAINALLPRDGSQPMTNALRMGGYRVRSIATASAADDAIQAKMVMGGDTTNCTMGGTGSAWTASNGLGVTSYKDGMVITGMAPGANSAGAFTLAYNSLTARAVKMQDGSDPPANLFSTGTPFLFVMQNSVWVHFGAQPMLASSIASTATGALSATNVQAALAELDADLTTEIAARTSAVSSKLDSASYTATDVVGKVNSVAVATANISAKRWDGANKTVSTSAPSGGSDGDIWFQREA